MSKRLALFSFLTTIIFLASCGGGAVSTFVPSNHIDPKTPCKEIDDKAKRQAIKDRVDEILKSQVIKAIQKQIDDAGKGTKVEVQVYLVTQAEFKKEVADDNRADLNPDTLWEQFNAFTYSPKDKKDIIKIKIFCKRSTLENLDTNKTRHGFDRLIVHELVHAKLLAMQAAGEKLPFDDQAHADDPPPADRPEDHNGKFSGEVEKLMKLLSK
jgi:hypothetical protein